jgi:hypothetical protein
MIKIITNNKPRHVVYGYELTEKEKVEFDYYTEEDLDYATFVRYKDEVHDLNEFSVFNNRELVTAQLPGWSGYKPDSYFSGTLLRWADKEFESVVMGRYMC